LELSLFGQEQAPFRLSEFIREQGKVETG